MATESILISRGKSGFSPHLLEPFGFYRSDGIVSFKDFLGVLTDNHRLAQYMGLMKSNRVCEPPGLQTLFLEVLFKLLKQGFVPSKSGQEMEEIERGCLSPLSYFSPPSYYLKKQRALRLSTCSKSRARGQGRPARAHTGLTFFCQAARLSGLSSTQLARSLHTLYRTGAPPASRGRGGWGSEEQRGDPAEGGKDAPGHPQPSPTSSRGGPSQYCPRLLWIPLPRWAQPLRSDSQPDRAPATRTQDLEPSPRLRRSLPQATSARPPQAPSQPGTTQQRSPPSSRRASEPATGANAPLEAGSLSANSSAEAPLLPFASLFPEMCYEELVQVKRLLSETGCAFWGQAPSRRASFANIFINLV
ncbi:uncharacterized protein LOC130877079 [Chionomys nivalis]|uniref:uncharacterized protein LOC130877079 n=1 Tax=Chionomys nivalis TaxID=269649 RepID=UPI002596F10B|nr:uncharacterized protein LOC130877079 [Chionomys nivalis]